MTFKLFLAAFIIVCCSLDSTAIDLTLHPRADGPLVVQATIAKLDSAFGSNSEFWDVSHSNFMRLLAYVETQDTAPIAMRQEQAPIVGLWGIDLPAFFDIHNDLDDLGLSFANEFRETLGVDQWTKAATFENMEIPLYSCINARLKLLIENAQNPDVCSFDNNFNFQQFDDDDEDGLVEYMYNYWCTCYRGTCNVANREEFKRLYRELQATDIRRCVVNTDLAFVLDSSGSIGEANWTLVRDYVRDVTDSIERRTSGDQETRVAIIRFSTEVFVDISLDSSQTELATIIDNLAYIGVGTNTHLALEELLDQPWDENALKIVIVLTDGQSNQPQDTLAALEELNNAQSLTIFVTGVADVDETEVLAIASPPTEDTYSYIETFQDTSALARTLNQQTYRICFTATTMVVLGDDPMQYDKFVSGSNVRFEYNVPETDSFTIRLCNQNGHVRLYGSFTVPNPNRAFNNFVLDAITNGQECEDVHISFESSRKKRQLSSMRTVYVSVEGVANSSSFTLETDVGNTVQFAVTCAQNPCGINTICTNNSAGGYVCDCVPGYIFGPDIVDCVDVNECEFLASPCSQFAACTNTNGSFECACLPGYAGDGFKCIIEQNTQHRFIVTVACATGGGLIVLVVVLAALIKIYKVTTAKKDSRYHKRDDRHQPSDTAGLAFANPAADVNVKPIDNPALLY